jgi:glutamate racemase
MNKTLPIGVFDSGLGGLTIVKAMQKALPGESLVYFGDTAHLPYGDKSPELVKGYSLEIARFLLSQPVKAIVIACNTASAVAYRTVQNFAGHLPVFDVIRPAVQELLSHSKNGKVGVIATKTTIHSGVYGRQLRAEKATLQVTEKATPLLVPMIEEGWLHNRISQDVIDAYMSDTGFQEIDAMILGCTHYPLIKKQIEAYFRQNYQHEVHVVDSSQAVASYVRDALGRLNLLNDEKSPPRHRYFLSDYTVDFQEAAKLFLNQEITFEKKEL